MIQNVENEILERFSKKSLIICYYIKRIYIKKQNI